MKAARRWLPWIGAYTSARINKLTPLTAADFVKRDGIWMIRIRCTNGAMEQRMADTCCKRTFVQLANWY